MKRTIALMGIAALALGCSRTQDDPYADEVHAREAFVKKSLDEADAGRALSVASTPEIQFEEGFGVLSFEKDPDDGHESITNHAFRWMGQVAHVRLKTKGARPMHLTMQGWAHHKVIATRPVVTVFIDGVYVASTPAIGEDGHYMIDQVIPEWALRRPWVDLVVRTNAVGFHWGDVPELRVLNVYRFTWTEAL